MRMLKIPNIIIPIAITTILVITLLFSCAPPPAKQFTIRFGVVASQVALPYYVILDQKLDIKNGLNFVETKFQSGDQIVGAIVNNSIDMSISMASTSIISAVEQGISPQKIVALAAGCICTPDRPMVAVLVNSSVSKWQDLEGKDIAVNAIKSFNTAAIKGRYEQEGVNNYKLVEMAAANMGLAVAGGNVAAAAMIEPYITQSVSRKDGKVLGWIIGGPPFENVLFTMVVSSTSFSKDYPQAVKNYLRAHLEAVKWIQKNPADARFVLVRQLNLDKNVGQNMNLTQWQSDGLIDPALLEKIQPSLVKVGMLKTPIPVNQLYDETLLKEVLAEKK
jgi:NitT/TauT family transport system substrate-binding protein